MTTETKREHLKEFFYRALPLPLPYLSKPIAVTILYSK